MGIRQKNSEDNSAENPGSKREENQIIDHILFSSFLGENRNFSLLNQFTCRCCNWVSPITENPADAEIARDHHVSATEHHHGKAHDRFWRYAILRIADYPTRTDDHKIDS